MKYLKKSGCIFVLLLAALIVPYIGVQGKSVRLNKSKISLIVGETVKLKLKNATGETIWSTSSKKIAKVSKNGRITAKSAGDAIITAKNNGKEYKCIVTIGEKNMPVGKWYDKNGDTMLEFKGDTMYATWWNGMTEPDKFNVKMKIENDYKYIINTDDQYGNGFGIMSMLEITDEGFLRAYLEELDGEGHTYVFVPEDRIEEEKAVKDFSTDKPKTIQSKEIKSFSMYLHGYSPENMYGGNYSWEIKKKDNGKYDFSFNGMGSSYVIIQYKSEVKAKYVKKLQKMIDEEKLVEQNGMFFSHDKYNTEYSLYVTYESGERLELKVGSKAIDKWPVDNKKFMDYAISIIPKKNIY